MVEEKFNLWQGWTGVLSSNFVTGGVTERNIHKIIRATGCNEIHGSARSAVPSLMTFKNSRSFMGGELRADEYSLKVTSSERVCTLLNNATKWTLPACSYAFVNCLRLRKFVEGGRWRAKKWKGEWRWQRLRPILWTLFPHTCARCCTFLFIAYKLSSENLRRLHHGVFFLLNPHSWNLWSRKREHQMAFALEDIGIYHFKPDFNLAINYGPLQVKEGDIIPPHFAHSCPSVDYPASHDTYYTLAMVDPDAPSRTHPELREWRHWGE